MARDSFRRWFDAFPEATLVARKNGEVLYANLAAAELLGSPASAISRKTLHQITVDQDEEIGRLLKIWGGSRGFVPGSLVFCLDGRMEIPCRVDGGLLPVAATDAPAPLVLRLSAKDSAVPYGRAEWMTILRSIGEGVVATSAAGEIVFMNPAAEEMTEWKESEARGQPVQVVMREEIVTDDFTPSESADSGECALLLSRYGGETLIAKRIASLYDEAGAISGSVIIFRDITGQFQAVRERERILEQLRQANECLKQLSYSASHDLQEPLRMVAIYSQLLGRKLAHGLDEDTAECLNYVVQGAQRMEAYVRALVSYTGEEPANVTGSLEHVDCGTALDAAIASLKLSVEESGAQIATGSLPVVQAHPVHVLQLFQNLVANAIRYCGERPPRIEINAIRHHHEWEFSVSDNGVGIPAQYHAQIFGVFKRLNARGPSVRTGIGLAICKRIVERYKGRIWVESKESRGSVFYFTLPAGNTPESEGGTSA